MPINDANSQILFVTLILLSIDMNSELDIFNNSSRHSFNSGNDNFSVSKLPLSSKLIRIFSSRNN